MDLTVLSFGGGQDSTALLYLYLYNEEFRQRYAPGRFVVVMSDTGDEHEETYEHVLDIQAICEEHGVEFRFLTPDQGYHLDQWQSLIHFYRGGDRIGSKAYPKTCTDKLKIQPIYKWLAAYVEADFGPDYPAYRKVGLKRFAVDHGQIRVLIGIAKGEEKRLAKTDKSPQWMQQAIERVYPLIDLGLDRAGCQNLIRAYGKRVPVPSHCRRCPFKTVAEVEIMRRDDPGGLYEWMRLERNKLRANRHKGDQNLGVWGKRDLIEVARQARDEYGQWSDEELHEHRMTHGHCVASAY